MRRPAPLAQRRNPPDDRNRMTHSALSPNPAARKRPAVAVDVDAAARRGLRRIWPGRISLGALALIGSSLTGLVIGAIVACILVLHARNAVREETDSAFHLASAIATVRLPTAFMREDMLYRATELANEIDGLRHVSARLVDARGQVLAGSDGQRRGANRAPEFLYHLLTPTPRSDIFPIRQYPNVVGLLYLETDPSDEIAKTWRNLRVILPLLALAVAAMIAVSVSVALVVQRRLRTFGRVLERMHGQDLTQRAPDSSLTELSALGGGVNALAAHLDHERAENRRLQGRIVTLTENERARIASDLHDDMGPQLFALRAAVEQARAASGREDEAQHGQMQDALDAIGRHAAEIQKSARSAIESLRPIGMDDASLGDLLHELAVEFSEIAPGTEIRLSADPAAAASDAAEISIYRFVRESVLNAMRHAAPGLILIELRREPGGLRARVTDNGSGAGLDRPPGLGQSGITERAAAVGATYLPPRRDGTSTITELWTPT